MNNFPLICKTLIIAISITTLLIEEMSSMTFGQKSFQAKPPDKGSFPLDHDGECKQFMMIFMKCLRENYLDNSMCRKESKEYLKCRMDHNLMAKEEWNKLGYQNDDTDDDAKNIRS